MKLRLDQFIQVDVTFYFEISNSEMYGGVGTVGYLATKFTGIRDISIVDVAFVCEQIRSVAQGLDVAVDDIRLISREEYESEVEEEGIVIEQLSTIQEEMEQLSLIQKKNLNEIYVTGEAGNSGVYHHYVIGVKNSDLVTYGICNSREDIVGELHFQDGPRSPGIMDTDLLEIIRHRLQCFQSGSFSSRANARALTHIEDALVWLNKRE